MARRCRRVEKTHIARQARLALSLWDVTICFYIIIKTRTRRNMDIDNRIKSVQDCLSMGRVIKNDSQIWDLRVIRILDKSLKEDCAEVMLFAIPESGSGVYIHNGDGPAWIQ